MGAGIASNDGFGDVDTLISIEEITGSNQSDSITSATSTSVIEGLDGDDNIVLTLGSIDIDGGLGSDTVDYSAFAPSNAIDVELDGLNTVTANIAASTNHTLTAVENIIGTQGNDILTGDGSDNTLDGGLGNDVLQGLGGDDTLIGGDGVDQADYSQAGAPVDIDLSAQEAIDDGEGGSDELRQIENLAGSNFNDTLLGDSSDNVIEGNSGDDTLRGGGGEDTLDGGADSGYC